MPNGSAPSSWDIPPTSGIGSIRCPRCKASLDEDEPRVCRICGASELDGRGPDLRAQAAEGERVRDLEELVDENESLRVLLSVALMAFDESERECDRLRGYVEEAW